MGNSNEIATRAEGRKRGEGEERGRGGYVKPWEGEHWEMDKNPLERQQPRHGPRCSCNSTSPDIANLVPFKAARIRKTAQLNTTDTLQQTQKLTLAT
jgi:hypothetical protein